MFNVTIINIKKSIFQIAIFISIIVILFIATKMIKKFSTNQILQIDLSEQLVKCLNSEIPAIATTNSRAENVIKEDGEEEISFSDRILNIELSKLENIEKQEETKQTVEEEQNHEESNSESKEDNQPAQETQQVATNLATEIVTQNPINESHNVECNGVKIKNETEFEINDSILNAELNINKNNIIIFHTHTCESYTPTEQYNYEQTGNYRTTDLNYSVARVGDELANYLIGYGFSVVHDKTYHDYPAYTGSYTRSKKTVEGILQSNPTDIIIDLHRDAIGSKSNYDPSVKIGDDVAAQLMFVIGTNGGGLYHPNWGSNLKFAIEFQAKANEMYPGLFKTMIVRNSRYNQNLGKAACIIEVGSTGNTLEQCINSMKYLSKVFEEYREQKRILITLTPIRTF